MMHEEDEFESRGAGRASRHYKGLVAWNAVHILIAVAAAAVAVSTSNWIDTKPRGMLGIDNAGLWSVCYTDVPDDETVDDLKRHLGEIVSENLFGASGASSTFNQQLEQELLDQDGSEIFKQELRDLLSPPQDVDAQSGNGTEPTPERFVDELADGEITPDMIPDDVKQTKSYQESLQRASVNVLVSEAVDDFPLSSGCTNAVGTYKDDKAAKFFNFVPYPYGGTSYYLFQFLRAFAVGFLGFGVLACLIFFGNLAASVGRCSAVNIGFGSFFATLMVICGVAGSMCYFILLARIASTNSNLVLNVSYMFVSEPIEYSIADYWGWSGWCFVGAAAWSLAMTPFLCCMCGAHRKSRRAQTEFGGYESRDKDLEMVGGGTPAGDPEED